MPEELRKVEMYSAKAQAAEPTAAERVVVRNALEAMPSAAKALPSMARHRSASAALKAVIPVSQRAAR